MFRVTVEVEDLLLHCSFSWLVQLQLQVVFGRLVEELVVMMMFACPVSDRKYTEESLLSCELKVAVLPWRDPCRASSRV
jgi:hypothetical protein